jgi:hypothetical protein
MLLTWTPIKGKRILQEVIWQLKKNRPVYRKDREFFFSSPSKDTYPCKYGPIALFWQGSYLFGLMAYWQLKGLGVPFYVITAEEIKAGQLSEFPILLIPGGWTRLKNEVLGQEGQKAIRTFVAQGGNYLGICGGCGLALKERDGLGLIACGRKKERNIANFYGKIKLFSSHHPFWEGLSPRASFYVWWPALFDNITEQINVIATYAGIGSDFYVADLNISDLKQYASLPAFAKQYRLCLDPEVLIGQPAVIEGRYKKGKVILTYPHLDTPNNPWEALALFNLWQYLLPSTVHSDLPQAEIKTERTEKVLSLACRLRKLMQTFMEFGKRQFLWYWSDAWMMRWRRGIRGFHYLTLYLMLKELEKQLKNFFPYAPLGCMEFLTQVSQLLPAFLEKAKRLLLQERLFLNHPELTLLHAPQPEITKQRLYLFGATPAFGGQLKEILILLEQALLPLLQISSRNQNG